jgi:hypothetical protein
MAGHLGSFGRAVTASARRRRLGDEGALDKPADRLRTRWLIHLLQAPMVN